MTIRPEEWREEFPNIVVDNENEYEFDKYDFFILDHIKLRLEVVPIQAILISVGTENGLPHGYLSPYHEPFYCSPFRGLKLFEGLSV